MVRPCIAWAVVGVVWLNGVFAETVDVDLTTFSPGPTAGWLGYGLVDGMGWAFRPGGDFNGDGLQDALIGAGTQHWGGSLYVVFGTKNFDTSVAATSTDAMSLASGAGVTIYSSTYGNGCGVFIDGGADFNGDGYDDVAMGCKDRNVVMYNDGSVFVIFGHGAPYADVDVGTMTKGSQGFVINGMFDYMNLGRVAFADVNGDGLADVIAGGPCSQQTNNNNGYAFVIFGTRSNAYQTVNTIDFNFDGVTGFKLKGHLFDDSLGDELSSLGDHNGDGYEDFAVRAGGVDYNGRANAGAVYVIFGHSNATAFDNIDIDTLPTATMKGFRVYGPSTRGITPSHSPGDINGDGFDDLLLSSLYSLDGSRGTTYVLFGHSGTFSTIDLDSYTFTSSTGYRISAAISYNGAAANFVGDVNGDGYDDLIVTSAEEKAGRAGSLTWYVVYTHGPGTTYSDVTLTDFVTSATTGYRIYSRANVNNAWALIAGKVGDINGDGVDDVGVALPLSSFAGRDQNGAAWMLLSPPPPSPTGQPSMQPSSRPSKRPSSQPSSQPTSPTSQPSSQPTSPTSLPSSQPSALPSVHPSTRPSAQPSNQPSSRPTSQPTTPSSAPSSRPTSKPSSQPTSPTAQPSRQPTSPTSQPSSQPTSPTSQPSSQPTSPTSQPSSQPTSPTSQPSGRPTQGPASLPSSLPTCCPSTQPSSRPSTQPTAIHYESVLASPTYRAQNGFAFAAIGDGGAVRTWGEAAYGADSSAVQAALSQDVARVVASRFAYAAVKSDGSVAVWGSMEASGPTLGATVTAHSLVAGEAAFAALEVGTGRVVATGSKHNGGNVLDDKYCNGYSAHLYAGVRSLTATVGAFAAIKADGSVYVWGNKLAGADVAQSFLAALAGTKFVVATRSAFAALLPDNRVATWGDAMAGGDSSAVAAQLQEVYHLTASRSCFVAFKRNTGVVVWGYGKYGGDTSAVAVALASGVTHVAHTFTAMAAVKADGTVVTWGRADTGGDSSAVQGSLADVVRVVGNGHAFAALTQTGGVVVWGKASDGGFVSGYKASVLSSGVVSIYHTDRAFAALKDDGSLVVWGQARHGGNPGDAVEALLTAEVHTVCANDVAFSAIKMDGSVVAWGHEVSVPADGLQFTAAELAGAATCA
jgi:hypothetical protein